MVFRKKIRSLENETLAFGLFSFLLIGTALQAALIRPLDDLNVIEVPISHGGLTRIAVKDDRILHVFGVGGEYVLEADEDQGQIFIRPNSLGSAEFSPVGRTSFKSISLTITTENGHTQDLRLTPRDQAPETLVLTKPDEDKVNVLKGIGKETLPTIIRDEVETLLQASQEGRIPLGYKALPLELKTLNLSLKDNPYPLVRELKGETLRCLTYEVKNTTKIPLILSEPEFAKQFEKGSHHKKESSGVLSSGRRSAKVESTVVAIFMPQKNLNPGEGTFVYVVLRSAY